ncbi:MAG: class I SAM-dependent methyltransferase [Coriobacteriales bacterium]|jgi:demethylmenaquinone methyltransferase/2-methoxy-6-polyprenyl-1,4-benzoquinol methylase|nr:class I SAM-dependent methyltransferase [Coriobacteriales bacterium]
MPAELCVLPAASAPVQKGTLPADSVARMTPADKARWVHHVFERISHRYDLMNDLESLGLHRLWKRALVERVVCAGASDILDVATGTGDIALALATRCPDAHVVGLDFSEAMLEVARRRVDRGDGSCVSLLSEVKRDEQEPSPVRPPAFVFGNALDMPFDAASFDAVTISFGLRNMPDYRRVLAEMVRVLRPGGLLLCLEASYPTLPLVKQGFRVYFRHVMPLMGRLIVKRSAEYRWLNDSTEAFLTRPELAQMMVDCGLVDVRYRSYLLGAAALHSGVKAVD